MIHRFSNAGVLLAALMTCPFADAGEWVYPLAVAADGDRLAIADRNWPGVWSYEGGELSELFAASKKFKTPLNAVRCVAVGPNGEVYAGCSSTRQVFRLDDDGPKKLAGDGVGIGIPMDLAVAPDGQIYVSDIELHRIFRLPAEGGEPEEVATVRAPRGLLWDNDGLVIVSHGENGLVRMTPDGTISPIVTGQPFNFPHDVARLGDSLYVTDGYEDGVWPVAANGTVGDKITCDGMTNPVGITSVENSLVIVDPRAKSLFSLTVGDDGVAAIVPFAAEKPVESPGTE